MVSWCYWIKNRKNQLIKLLFIIELVFYEYKITPNMTYFLYNILGRRQLPIDKK